MSNNVDIRDSKRVETIIANNKRKLLWYLVLVVFLFATITVLYFKFINEQKKVVHINKENQKNIVELSNLKNKTFLEIESLTKIIDSLSNKNDSLINKFSKDNNVTIDASITYQRKKKQLEIQVIKNSEYLIGGYSYNTTIKEDKLIAKYIVQLGYTLEGKDIYRYENYKPDWMSASSTVFYYTNSSKNKASEIAKQLSKLTGKQFVIKIGAGLGVIKGQEAVTFFIHNLPN